MGRFRSVLMAFMVAFMMIMSNLLVWECRAQGEELVQVEGKFYVQEDDERNFIKQQLIYQATREVISSTLKTMNQNADEFWRIYEERFNTYFAPIKDKLMQDFKIANEADMAKNANFQKALRLKQLTSKNNFGRLERVMLSYKINKISRATNSPNLRFINISAKVDRNFLNELYASYLRKLNHRNYATLYVSVDLDLFQGQGEELGIISQVEWEKSILESWQKRLKEELSPQVVENVQIASGELEVGRLQKLLALDLGNSDGQEIQENLENAIWLQVKIKIGQKTAESGLAKVNLKFTGSSLLHDLKNKQLLFFRDLSGEIKGIATADKKQLAVQVASTVSQLPLSSFLDMEKQLANRSSLEKNYIVKVMGHKSIQDIIDLQRLLLQEGVSFELKSGPKFFAMGSAALQISMVGASEEIKNFWQKLAGKNINANLQMQAEVLTDVTPEQVSIRLQ